MQFEFLNRNKELKRLGRVFESSAPAFICLYGRRRCGKSRLLLEALKNKKQIYYVGDNREASLQRTALSKEIARLLPGFDSVEYPGWEEILDRWFSDAPQGSILAFDEFPFLVSSSPELPFILQKFIDKSKNKNIHIAICGSSQRMMLGLLLHSSAPLYGRAKEIMKIEPLNLYYLKKALNLKNMEKVIEAYAYFGGVPRYWELAADYEDIKKAAIELILDPLGVLHREPERLLTDELRDTRQASSILALIGMGCHRLSEIASRIGRPSTSLTRPIKWLIEMGMIKKETPFNESFKNTKRSLYKIDDPFLSFWYKFVEPNRSLLNANLIDIALIDLDKKWKYHLSDIWEDLARKSAAYLMIDNCRWKAASRWWGGTNKKSMEIDIVAQSIENKDKILIGEVKLSNLSQSIDSIFNEMRKKVSLCPLFANKKVSYAVWILKKNKKTEKKDNVFTAKDVVNVFV
jgi:uncharacterized protein